MLFSTVCFHWLRSVRVVISLRFLRPVFVSPYVDRLTAGNYVSVGGGRGSEGLRKAGRGDQFFFNFFYFELFFHSFIVATKYT